MKNKKLDIFDIINRILYTLNFIILMIGCYFGGRAYVGDWFIIPTSSMEPTLIPGDEIIVNKLIAGARIYDEFDFGEGVPMKSHRTKGIRNIEHNDVVVFNCPISKKERKIEFEINYVYCKRCVGLPGDSISIKNGFFKNNNFEGVLGNFENQKRLSETPDSMVGRPLEALPYDKENYGWTIKEFGPLYIPKKGDTLAITKENFKPYRLAINFETGKKSKLTSEGKIVIGDSIIHQYTFQRNYYFMCGDNVMNSNDSRYWGFVPEEFVIGVVSHILYSRDRYTHDFRHSRWVKSVR